MSSEPSKRRRQGPTPESMTHTLWRVFPWDADAAAGDRFSPSYIPRPTGRGRFDLPQALSPVLYTSESAEHAVSEMLHPWRGRTLEAFHLTRANLPLALWRSGFPPTPPESSPTSAIRPTSPPAAHRRTRLPPGSDTVPSPSPGPCGTPDSTGSAGGRGSGGTGTPWFCSPLVPRPRSASLARRS